MKLLGTPGRGVTTVGMKEYVPLSEDCAPPGVPHLKLGKNYGSNTVASLLMKHIYSLLSLKKNREIQVVKLFDFVRQYNNFLTS